jgi:hypothetical protein
MKRVNFRYGIVTLLLCSSFAAPQLPAKGRILQLSQGTISGKRYANSELGFGYQLPDGWSVNEQETVVAHRFAWVDEPSAKTQTALPSQCSKRLLFVTKHPEGMRLNSFDPMALLIAVDPNCFPAIPYPKSPADRETAQRSASQILSHLQTPGSVVRAPARVRVFDNGGRVMLEVSRPLSISTNEATLTTLQNVNRSVLMMPAGGYWVIWIFVSGEDAEMDRLKATKIFFDVPAKSSAVK